jgi:uncharacterized protein (TIGR01777 family)
MNAQKRIILAGGSGFLGNALAQIFQAKQYEVVVFTRSPRSRVDGVKEVAWDGKSQGDWTAQVEGANAIINLTGKNINCPHTPENLRLIAASRVDSCQAVATAIHRTKVPPVVWVQASAVGFYGDTGDKSCDETAANGSDALSKICADWEAAGNTAVLPQTRKVILRIGFVLGREGGALPMLVKITKLFLGGSAGSGRQFISWIHLADLTQMFVAAVEDSQLSGVLNAVAPRAATNAEFMRKLRQVLHRPWSPPVPVFAIKLGSRLMGSASSLVLTGQRCVPGRFLEARFQFRFPELGVTLKDLCR